ncbi:RNAse (barnase) inhibitor barstar [Arthrobacter sp. PvP102]|uniref:barstar family protein n=1 Tax=unclassified Arthrobacter TaxID=235627 RepID=UPI001AE3B22F|nr:MULTISPECIES: barstar family protein [unclassified Arthrobacter]MBP1234255.1 RNAse (barnase) inhibitor barstar [Arthrobacter sp. PvP103]MBP1239389.1 RNAse (barnase) inhibitor barstar [Arthrobacter sp. PvP102]
MKIYSADTWTVEELREQAADAGRRVLVIPAADTKRAVLQTFGEVLDFPEHYGVNLDALNDSLHDFADTVTDHGKEPLTFIWQVPAAFRSDRSFGIICEILQDAESYAGKGLSVITVCL